MRFCDQDGKWIKYPYGAKYSGIIPLLEGLLNLNEPNKPLSEEENALFRESLWKTNYDNCIPPVLKCIYEPQEFFQTHDCVCFIPKCTNAFVYKKHPTSLNFNSLA